MSAMSPHTIMRAVRMHLDTLSIAYGRGSLKPTQASLTKTWLGHRQRAAHVMWMLERILDLVESDLPKAERWLGFAQGVLWVLGLTTIEELRQTNLGDAIVAD